MISKQVAKYWSAATGVVLAASAIACGVPGARSKYAEPLPNPCLNGVLVAEVVPARAGSPRAIPHAAQILSPAALTRLGGTVQFIHAAPPRGVPAPEVTVLAGATRMPFVPPPLPSVTASGAAIENGGQVAGKSSCDFALSDNPAAARLAASGARALAKQGFPTQASGSRGSGEQRYLLKSSAFLAGVAYILYIVADPTSLTTNPLGMKQYTRNLYAIAAVAPDGTVLDAAELAP